MSGRGSSEERSPVYLVRGEDPSLVNDAVRALIAELVGGEDTGLAVEDYQAGEVDIASVIDACCTQSLLASVRVVVLRNAGRLGAHEGEQLATYLRDPSSSTFLVLVSGGGAVPVKVTNAVKRSGRLVETSPGTGRARAQWMTDRLSRASVRLDRAAAERLSDHLGDDLGRLSGLLDALAAAYGDGAKITPADLAPFLASAGSVPPWDLTDAIDAGDTGAALKALARMLGAGGTHPLAIAAVLNNHFGRMLRLDGAGARSADQAATLLGVKSSFVAGKVLAQGRRLGSERVERAILLLADADLDLRGASGLDPEVVIEVLVARLSRLAGAGSRHRPRQAATSR
ncbi:MAG: DNA polymerase III subunit delta [Actinomycetota bacterium]|nr:DNA polymerase III subunit delta [Actinomycetota bacterium]